MHLARIGRRAFDPGERIDERRVGGFLVVHAQTPDQGKGRTLTQHTGLPPRDELEGVSLKPLLLKSSQVDWPDRRIFSHWRGRVSVRTQRHRLDHQYRRR